MRVLSLFDWMACWYEALVRAWFKVDEYYASEIDKYAIQIALKNHPDIIEIGDVCQVKWEDYQGFDLIIWWSPCTWFSMAWKMLNFEDPQSKLFFEYVRILNEVKPKYFLLENVKMKKEYQDKITEILYGIEPVEINSSLLSAQNRKRLYRVGELQEDGSYKKVDIPQPEDKGILLKDIIEDEVDEKYYFSKERWDRIVWWTYEITKRIEDQDWKCATLTTVGWWNTEKKIFISYPPWSREFKSQWFKEDKSPTLCARDYKDPKVIFLPCATQYSSSANFWNAYGSQRAYTLRASTPNGVIEKVGVVRKLTPKECERLQTMPDGYSEWVSDSQRYKMLWNWWTCDIISHIFTHLLK